MKVVTCTDEPTKNNHPTQQFPSVLLHVSVFKLIVLVFWLTASLLWFTTLIRSVFGHSRKLVLEKRKSCENSLYTTCPAANGEHTESAI